jgi:hypothetical protein
MLGSDTDPDRPDPDRQNDADTTRFEPGSTTVSIKCTHLTVWIYLSEGSGSTHAFQLPQLSHAVQNLPEN